MLDDVTKKRINTLRQILVGKLPDPKAQVEQITNGLIYKFMNDMDEQSVSIGGKSTYFSGKYQKYSWKNLMNTKTSGVEKIKLYSEAIEKMYNNENLPELFREIFKNSFLPFKDPSTLNMFLKEINEFNYSNSEKLGDAFEYLLSFMGSQGDAGQFRTPRHIIDFIVKIINPQKNETILDPACGTAGFLISSYKHILNQNTKKNLGDDLTASDRKKIGENLNGYDISPDMVKMSLVNMYLHKFTNPKINEYDTLSSEDRWNEYYNVILANPPFFSPQGGITPHNRFGVSSSKAEVLFVDYINEHLKPNGRAGIIVPEGIIFQTGKAYKQLRKRLLETSLIGVISLPAGVFQPYSGVKTSIIILDKEKNKKNDAIFFANVRDDGFALNANREKIKKNDLPLIIKELEGNKNEIQLIHSVKKNEIIKNDFVLDYNSYKKKKALSNKYSSSKIGEVCKLFNGKAFKREELLDSGKYKVLRVGNFFSNNKWFFSDLELDNDKYCDDGDLLYAWSASFGAKIWKGNKTIYHYHIWKIVNDETKINKLYLKFLLDYLTKNFKETGGRGGIMMHLTKIGIEKEKIPVPPLEVQNQIAEELNNYHKIIDGCNKIIENYKPSIDIDTEWKMYELGNLVDITRGGSPRPINEFITDDENGINWIKISDATKSGKYIYETKEKIIKEGAKHSRQVKEGDFILSNSMSVGRPYIMKTKGCIHDGWLLLRKKSSNITDDFLYYILSSENIYNQFKSLSRGGVVNNLNKEIVSKVKIPLPEIKIQNKIVELLEEERKIIINNEVLIKNFSKKIDEKISSIWSN